MMQAHDIHSYMRQTARWCRCCKALSSSEYPEFHHLSLKLHAWAERILARIL